VEAFDSALNLLHPGADEGKALSPKEQAVVSAFKGPEDKKDVVLLFLS
jgi:hypothetical protein